MVTTATVVRNDVQGNKRRCYYRYNLDGGVVIRVGPIKAPLSFDPDADAAARITGIEEIQRRNERARALSDCFDGRDIDALFDSGAYPHLTRATMRRRVLRRIANMLEGIEHADKEQLAGASVWVSTLTNATIANRLGPGWSNSEANTLVKRKLIALAADVSGLPHGKGALEDED